MSERHLSGNVQQVVRGVFWGAGGCLESGRGGRLEVEILEASAQLVDDA